jgi:tetratricopeptide (TPR) repeat protein
MALETQGKHSEAVVWFGKAWEEAGDKKTRALARLDLGRCEYKWAIWKEGSQLGSFLRSITDIFLPRLSIDRVDKTILKRANGNLNDSIGEDPEHDEAYYWLAVCLGEQLEKGDLDNSLKQFGTAISKAKTPEWRGIYLDGAFKVAMQTMEQSQIRLVNEWASKFEGFHRQLEAGYLRGHAFELDGKYEEARQAYTKALKIPPKPEDKRMQARLHLARGACVYNHLRELIKQESENVVPQSQKDAEDAARLAEDDELKGAALELGADIRQELMSKSENAQREKLFKEAREKYEEALKTAPRHPTAWAWHRNFAHLYLNYLRLSKVSGDKKTQLKNEALKQAKEALRIVPRNPVGDENDIRKLIKEIESE